MMDSQEEKKAYTTKQEVLERVKEIAHSEENPSKEEVDLLKTIFYKLHIAEREAQQKEYLDAGGDPEKYQVLPDETEEAFKAEMNIIKEKRAKLFLEQEAEKKENLKKKLEIIEKVKSMATSPEEANKSYQEFKELQQQWREIKAVPAENANELWKTYQLYVEQFYDLLKLNSEAREYDFKKNLEIKTRLCEAAEKLADEEDVISAFHQLQELHQQYREAGPVAKDLREEVWARFKAASTVINKRHQQHFESLRAQEEENLAKKTALCEKVEAIGKEAVKLLSDGESLFIDSSSTAYCFVKAIPKDMRLNVVTNGLYIAQSFHEHPHVHVELVGGQYDPHHACLIGAEASHFIQSRFADWFFVSANAMDTHCITSQSNIDIDLKQCMHTHAQQTILLMDDSKFLNTSFYKVFDLYDIDQLITNHLPSEMEDALIENQVLIKKAVQ